MTTTLFINSIASNSHFGTELATFGVSTTDMTGVVVKLPEVFASFYDTCNDYDTVKEGDDDIEIAKAQSSPISLEGWNGKTVFAVKCTAYNNRWCICNILFAKKKEAKAWLAKAKKTRDGSEESADPISALCSFDDLDCSAERSEDWFIEVIEIEVNKVGWSEWSND